MKKYIFSALAIAAMMVSCNNATPKMDEQPAAASGDGLKIAFVEVDSLMTQYDFAKDYSVTLQKNRTMPAIRLPRRVMPFRQLLTTSNRS